MRVGVLRLDFPSSSIIPLSDTVSAFVLRSSLCASPVGKAALAGLGQRRLIFWWFERGVWPMLTWFCLGLDSSSGLEAKTGKLQDRIRR